MHFALGLFNCVGIFAETALVVNTWWTGIMRHVGVIAIVGLVVGQQQWYQVHYHKE